MKPLPQTRAECLIIGDNSFKTLAEQNVLRLCAEQGVNLRPAWWNVADLAPDPADPTLLDHRDALVRDLCAACLALVDLTLDPSLVHYLLGAREALTSGITLACYNGAKPAWATTLLTPTFLDLARDPPERIGELIAPLREVGRRDWVSSFRASRAVNVSEAAQELDANGAIKSRARRANESGGGVNGNTRWSYLDRPRPKIGLRFGDLGGITDVACWVNSENVNMLMARDVEKSVSARIRGLGARRTGPDLDHVDDAIFLELARAMGARRRLEVGEVLMTPAPDRSDLREKNKVRAVAHVATVVSAGPGRGWIPGGNVGACVANTLERVYRYACDTGQEATLDTILFPLLAAGDAGMPPPVAASQMVSALADWIKKDGAAQDHFECIYLLARDARTRDTIVHALDSYEFKR